MKVKNFLKKLLRFVLVLVTFIMVVPHVSDILDEEISYSKAIQIIETQESNIKKIVIDNKNNKITITLKKLKSEVSKSKEIVVFVPDTKDFIEKTMEVKESTKADFEVIVSHPMNVYVWNFIKVLIIYLIIEIIWNIIFLHFEKKPTKNVEKDEKSNISKDSTKKEKKTKLSMDFDKGQGTSSIKELTKMFSNDFTEEIEMHLVKEVTTTFDDVAGMENAKNAMKDVALGIVNSEIYEENGAKIPSGILLEGEPGTGKTLLARALAGEIKVPFLQFSATEMSSKWVGESEEKVRQIFNYAKKNSPCIIFFDEIDSIATSRKKDIASHERKLLDQLLTSLDGFNPRDKVIFIAATNLAETLDEAIKRPGRFDRIVHIDLPDEVEREAILKVHARNKKLSSDINLKELAQNTATLSGAVLANILNEAAILQIKNNHGFITIEDLEEAHRITLFGYPSTSKVKESERHLAAVHELGHAVTSDEDIKEISIIPRVGMGGYTWYVHEEKAYITANMLKKSLVSLLGGRAAEKVILGEISTGAENDMEKAYKIAYDYITRYGMSDIGPISIQKSNSMSEESKEEIWKEAKKLILEAYEKAEKMIESKRSIIEDIANVLEEKGTIRGKEYYYLLSNENFM